MRNLSRRRIMEQAALLPGSALLAAETPPPARKLHVVVTGGHPGDPEYGCGGTIARYTDLGHDVALLYLNRGEGGIQGKPPAEVGAIRTAARFTFEPEEILQELNLRLLGRGDARATCLALTIAASGTVNLANAGHLPPYRNGRPIELDGSLPLGMLESPGFTHTQLALIPGDRLTLVSDGIAEAAGPDGELFGFERTESLLERARSAAEIADAAQAFGQQDDISVIAITRLPAA